MKPQKNSAREVLEARVQYTVPAWQRRYCWRKAQVERLIEDLLTAAQTEGTHYGGTIITRPFAGGEVTTIQVVDGQQRLTTLSIVAALCAWRLREESYGAWTRESIRQRLLRNDTSIPDRRRKLRLQEGDEAAMAALVAYDGKKLDDATSITRAWHDARRMLEGQGGEGERQVLDALERLALVQISLEPEDDAQQIFESLNGTGLPLAESEKVKNWLLMHGSPDEQDAMHRSCWEPMEAALDARHEMARLDEAFRDILRWKTGQVAGIDKVYEGIRTLGAKEYAGAKGKLANDLRTWVERYGLIR